MGTSILINEATLYRAKHGGVARYMRHIIEAAALHYGRNLAVCSAHRLAPGSARWIPSPRFRGSGRLRTTDLVASAASAVLRPRVYFGGYYGAVRTSAAQVFPVYDLIHELYAPAAPDAMLRRDLADKRRCLERAAALFAISRNTAADIVRVYPMVDASKIVVTLPGVDDVFFTPPPPVSAGRPYFLFVGFRRGPKNFLRLIEAFAASGLAGDFDLLVVSRMNQFDDEERVALERGGVRSSVRLMRPVGDRELAGLYAAAAALLYPSEYEGFGFPVLEAMAAGTIVATSQASSLPEVGGPAAFYFDPHDVGSMAAAIREVVNLGAVEREQRRREGVAWARSFTWSRCQTQTIEVLDRLIRE